MKPEVPDLLMAVFYISRVTEMGGNTVRAAYCSGPLCLITC